MNGRLSLRLGRWVVMVTVAAGTVVHPATAGDFKVIQKDREFAPRELRIRAGDEVTFVNDDPVVHNVYSVTRGSEFEIRKQVPGQANTIRFSRPGEVEVECAVHPNMHLIIHVAR